ARRRGVNDQAVVRQVQLPAAGDRREGAQNDGVVAGGGEGDRSADHVQRGEVLRRVEHRRGGRADFQRGAAGVGREGERAGGQIERLNCGEGHGGAVVRDVGGVDGERVGGA